MSQGARTQVLDEFKKGQWDVLVTTDLASRGIDIAQLPVVLNYDLPRSAVDYVHRIGRTGRAGESGLAVSFVGAATEAHFALIEKRQRLSLPRERIAGFEPVETAAPVDLAPVPGTGGIKGKRPSKKDKLRAAVHEGSLRSLGQVCRRPSGFLDRFGRRFGSGFNDSRAVGGGCRPRLAVTRFEQNFDIELRAGFFDQVVDRCRDSGQMHHFGGLGREAELAVEVPVVHARRQHAAPLALDVFANFVFDRVQNPVRVLAFDGELESFLHARW